MDAVQIRDVNSPKRARYCRYRTWEYITNSCYLLFGGGQLLPNSCTCKPKKQTSTPSITWKANIAFARYGNFSGNWPVAQNLKWRNALHSENRAKVTNRTYLAFICGLTSTSLSELESTRMTTSPAGVSGGNLFFKKSFTRVSKCCDNLQCNNPKIKLVTTQKGQIGHKLMTYVSQ